MRCIGFTIKYFYMLRYIPPNQKLLLSVATVFNLFVNVFSAVCLSAGNNSQTPTRPNHTEHGDMKHGQRNPLNLFQIKTTFKCFLTSFVSLEPQITDDAPAFLFHPLR